MLRIKGMNRTLKRGLITMTFGILLLSASPCVFGDVLELTLKDAVALGLKNSLDIKSKQLALNAADKDVKAAQSAYYPGITASTDYSHSFDNNQQGVGTIGYDPDQLGLSVNLNQTIYSFGRITKTVQEAEKSRDLAAIDLNEAKRSLAVDIQRSFYTYLLAKETLSVKEESLKYRQEALDNANARYKAGLTTRREVLQAESDLKSFIPEVISARNDIKNTLLKLSDTLGIGSDTEVVIKGSLDVPDVKLDSKKLVQEMHSKNSSIRQSETNIALQKISGELSETEKLPTVSGFAGFSLQNGFDIGAGDFSGNNWDSSLSAGIKIQMDFSSLFPWSKQTANVEKSNIELEKLNTDLEVLRDNARLKIESLLLDLSKEKASIEAGKAALDLAKELFLVSKDMYENGLISSMEYDNTQISLKDSNVSYLTYIYDYRMSLYDLMDAVGTDHF
jgi:outer membrane protein